MPDYLDAMLELVAPERRDMAARYVDELRWMDEKLDQARQTIKNTAIVIPYDNGGGQTGIRANPAFGEYEKLFRSWDAAARSLVAMVPADAVPHVDESEVSPLDIIRAKRAERAAGADV